MLFYLYKFIAAGCGCTYTLFGCCPDNTTAARGPNNFGCGCQYTEHKCCPDNITPASGPQYQGCPCQTYQFGCCSDGITKAVGPNSQGTMFNDIMLKDIFLIVLLIIFKDVVVNILSMDAVVIKRHQL